MGPEMQQDPLRLKSLTRRAQRQLEEFGADSRSIDRITRPVRELEDDGIFWRTQEAGLAIFSSTGLFRHYRLPVRFEELVVVSDRFHVKPLLPLFLADGPFYVLALSKSRARLVHATGSGAHEIEVEGMPKSLDEALQYDGKERQLQFRASVPTGRGERSVSFHGHGTVKEEAKDDIMRYCRQVDRAVTKHLAGRQAPVVLAGVDYVVSLYRKTSAYQPLVDDSVPGNPDAWSPHELRERALPKVEPLFAKSRAAAVARFRDLGGTTRVSDRVEEVVPAAHRGRVETVIVPVGVQVWGGFDRVSGRVEIHAGYEPGDDDMLDLAALSTILNGGEAYAVAPEDVPGHALVAAVFRF